MKKVLSILLTVLMIAGILPQTVFGAGTSTGKLDEQMEFEKFNHTSTYEIEKNDAASGGKCLLTVSTGTVNIPDNTSEDIMVRFNVDKEDTYDVWFLYSAESGKNDSIYLAWDNDEYKNTGLVKTGTQFGWAKVSSVKLSPGRHNFRIAYRETATRLDAMYVTADKSYKPSPLASELVIKSSLPEVEPIGNIYELSDGIVFIEAEDTKSEGKIKVLQNKEASGGKTITFINQGGNMVSEPNEYGLPAVTYSFKAESKQTHYAWARVYASSGANDSLWCTFDNIEYINKGLDSTAGGFTWAKIAEGTLDAGIHTLNIIPREYVDEIDKIIITTLPTYTPVGEGQDPNENIAGEVVYPEPSIKPPAGHPRVYFTKDDIAQIKENLTKPENSNAYERYMNAQKDNAMLTIHKADSGNYSAVVLNNIECRAFAYAIEGNTEMGKSAVESMYSYLENTGSEDYNGIGQIIYTAAVVYDWCYDLMSTEQRDYFCVRCVGLATTLEVGWPPTKQGSVVGHGVECSLFRDLFALGIAVYDERSDIYDNVAGRLLTEHIPARKYFYGGSMNMQGDHYTSYRSRWEYLCTRLFDAMGYPNIFGDEQENLLDWMIYARRGDGQILRDGDTSKNNNAVGAYDNAPYRSLLLAASYYQNPYLKWEGLRELPGAKLENPTRNRSMNAVEFLLFNDPDLKGRSVSELPYSKYFDTPKGAMIARTGWQDGFDSPAVVCEMKVNEYWTGNHQHLDAGAFQIYYKGPLATDSGYYQAGDYSSSGSVNKEAGNNGNTGYGSYHDFGYFKNSIAHNVMLIYDPNEVATNDIRWTNDGGQRHPNSKKEPNNLETFLNPANGYKTAQVLGHEFGPDNYAPDYTYLKGDLTQAYSDKISDYERSFMFLNLKNDEYPAALVVFDRVISSDASFKKYWLCHGAEAPEVNGSRSVFKVTNDEYNGKLVIDTLLPKADNLEISTVTDKTNFDVFGVNYLATPAQNGCNEGGACRIAVSPKKESEEDYFLNVLQVGDADGTAQPLNPTLIENDDIYGAVIADRAVIFAKAKERISSDISFDVENEGEFEITVCGVKAGTWLVNGAEEVSATDEGGVLCFNGGKGAYTLTYKNDMVTKQVNEGEIRTSDTEYVGLKVNGRYVYSDVEPFIVNDRTLVPMRVIFEKLGADVVWDGDTATATATLGECEIKITEGSEKAYVNGEEYMLDSPAMTKDGRFVVPVRFVSESFGATVGWDEYNSVVSVSAASGIGTRLNSSKAATASSEGKVKIVGYDCSGVYESTTPDLSFDLDIETWWSVSGYEGHWISYKLEKTALLNKVRIMWNKGNIRKSKFDVEVSEDGVTWTKVIDTTESSGEVLNEFEDYSFSAPAKAKFVRVNGYGNSANAWNTIVEIEWIGTLCE